MKNKTKAIVLILFLALMWLMSCGVARKLKGTDNRNPTNSSNIPMG